MFGEGISPAETMAAAQWIVGARDGSRGTIGGLVPSRYPLILRVHPPNPSVEDYAKVERDVFGVIASIGARYTSTPEQAWFAVWEGHGFAGSGGRLVSRDEFLAEVTSGLPAGGQWTVVEEAEEAEVPSTPFDDALNDIPRFDLTHRSYYLLTGTVSAVTQLEHPSQYPRQQKFLWREPDLFWPHDKQWFVASDTDLWSLYIGGDHDFITELAQNVPTESELVSPGDRLEAES